ncbi:MAG: MerR family transcriptional regulator [Pseudomonadota bacterium]
MLKIGDVAKKTGISIRSLRHYDKIGLLKPSYRSESAYRLYDKSDLLRLQHIISLKQMGFSLKKIRSMLQDNTVNLRETVAIQLNFLHQQLQQQQSIYQQVKHVHDLLAERCDISLETICNTVEAIKMLEKYYSKNQLNELKQRHFYTDEKEEQKYAKAWQDIFTGLKKLQADKVPATDIKTKPFAEKARELINLFTAGNKGIEKSLHKMYEQEGGGQMLRNHGLDVSDELFEYYEKALHCHAK